MRRLVCLLCLCATAVAQESEPPAGERAFLDLQVSSTSAYVQQPVRIRLVIGFDREFFAKHAVRLFSRRLDVPLQVEAPWLDGISGALVPAGEMRGTGLALALNGEVTPVPRGEERRVNGRAYDVLVLDRTFLPTREGEAVIPASILRYAWATEFEEDFVSGRRPVDPQEVVVRGKAAAIRVKALPAEGRPQDFGGAVGDFTVSASADTREVEVGKIFRLTLRIEGQGNLGAFDTPRLDGLEGFHVYGVLDDRGAVERTITCDLAAGSASVREVPPIPLAFFDPGPPALYRTATTASIPLTIRPASGTGAPQQFSGAVETEACPPGLYIAWAIALAGVTAAGFLLWRRRRAHGGPDPADLRLVEAEAAVEAALDDPDADLASTLAELLGAYLDCPASAVIAPNLPERLSSADVPSDLAGLTSGVLEQLVADRYAGGGPQADARDAVRALLKRLRSHFGGAAQRSQ